MINVYRRTFVSLWAVPLVANCGPDIAALTTEVHWVQAFMLPLMLDCVSQGSQLIAKPFEEGSFLTYQDFPVGYVNVPYNSELRYYIKRLGTDELGRLNVTVAAFG